LVPKKKKKEGKGGKEGGKGDRKKYFHKAKIIFFKKDTLQIYTKRGRKRAPKLRGAGAR
jgi:hypothetical protein